MPKVYAFVADGTEEVELLAVVDILRRAEIETVITSVDGATVTSSHGVKITADRVVGDCDFADADMLFLPGGMPGTRRLAACKKVVAAVDAQLKKGKRVAAICAAPAVVLGANGFLKGKKAVCFPTFESDMKDCEIMRGARVVTDGNVTTARGMGCTVDLGLELVKLLKGEAIANDIKNKIQY